METKEPTILEEAAYPLFLMAYLLGSQSKSMRILATAAILKAAMELAQFMERMKHMQDCEDCDKESKQARSLMDLLDRLSA